MMKTAWLVGCSLMCCVTLALAGQDKWQHRREGWQGGEHGKLARERPVRVDRPAGPPPGAMPPARQAYPPPAGAIGNQGYGYGFERRQQQGGWRAE